MKLGVVGLPNVGKSTLFNAITEAGGEAQNYPFCTIEPNVGVVAVPDKRLDALAKLYNTQKVTPAIIEFVDIAGIVKGASKGEGACGLISRKAYTYSFSYTFAEGMLPLIILQNKQSIGKPTFFSYCLIVTHFPRYCKCRF